MSTICPNCNSPNISSSQIAQHVGASIGSVGGAVYGYRISAVFGPVGMFTGAIAGLIGGAIAGCEAGHAVGKVIDEKVINEHQCNNCQHTFSS
jgi:outer membrane lipoprotein SlyB